MTVVVPDNFLTANESNSKEPVIIIEIDGLADVLSSAQVYEKIYFGMPGLTYGGTDPGTGLPYVYGGLRTYVNAAGGIARSYIDLNASSLTLSQTIEPEQGRASISQLSVGFIDKDQYMTRLISPGIVLPEILGRNVKVWLGYQTISYPEDYRLVFRGSIQGIDYTTGRVVLQLADANLIRKQQLFYQATTTLGGNITSGSTTIPVGSNGDFTKKIAGPSGGYDTNVKLYMKIGDEFIEYQPSGSEGTGFGTNTFTSCVRGARGTTAVSHSTNDAVDVYAEVSGHPIDIALKIMLSGWNGPWITGQTITNIVTTTDPNIGDVPGGIIIPVDAIIEYGLAVGDYITITGDSHGANNITVQVTDFGDVNGFSNRLIYTTGSGMVPSINSTGVFSIRSQYDVWPDNLSMGMKAHDVDVETHQTVRDTLTSTESMRVFISGPISSGKEFIEKELFLPIGAYSITRQGAMSVKVTLPPIADDRIQFLTADQLINPTSFKVSRGTSNRKFFNEVQFDFDYDDTDTATSSYRQLDTNSLNNIGVSSVLPIASKGTRSDLTAQSVIQSRATKLLNRYKNGAIQLMVDAQFGVGTNTEAGDVVAIQDNGTLQIANMANGTRNLGTQLFEVINRSLAFKGGKCTLTLLSGLSFSLQDVFATFAPSSIVNSTGSTTSTVKIIKSYGAKYGDNEYKKWINYVNNQVKIRKSDYSVSYTRTLVSVAINNVLTLDTALPITPDSTYIVELADYSTSTNSVTPTNLNSKLVHCFFDSSVPVVAGTSSTQFIVGSGDVYKFIIGYPLVLHTNSYTSISPEVTITNVSGTTITVTDMGFTPTNTYKCELVAWDDARGPYRFV